MYTHGYILLMWLPLTYATICALGYKVLMESKYYRKELNKMFEHYPHKKYIYVFVGSSRVVDYLARFLRFSGLAALVWAVLYAAYFSLVLGHIK
jgi:hypothetical protein